MAKSKQSTAVAKVEPKSTALATPDYLKGYSGPTGSENIDVKDVTIPRILIGQSMSPEVKAGNVEEGDLFLNITGEVLAKKGVPLPFAPLVVGKEFILWRDRDDGGGIFARARRTETPEGVIYAWDKPNQSFEHKVGGKVKVKWTTGKCVEQDGLGDWGSEIPGDKESKIAATAHHNIIVALPTHGDLIAAFSLSKSQSKRAKDFNAMLKLGSAPIFARMFTATTEEEVSGENKYSNVRMLPAGFVPDAASFERYKGMALGFVGVSVTVDHTGGESQGGDAAPAKPAKGGKF